MKKNGGHGGVYIGGDWERTAGSGGGGNHAWIKTQLFSLLNR